MSRRLSILFLALPIFLPSIEVAAQSWKLPHRGAVFYARDRVQTPPSLGGRSGFCVAAMPPVLFQGELDRKQQRPALTPIDLRDLPAFFAFDLRRARGAGRIKLIVDGLKDLGPLELTGKISSVDETGMQSIDVRFQTTGKDFISVYSVVIRASGTIAIRRKVDLEKGVVSEFRSELRAVFDRQLAAGADPSVRDPSPVTKCKIEERWTLDRVEKNRPAGFRQRVAEAIRRGAGYIKGNLALIGAPGDGGHQDVSAGELALALLTLVKAEVDRKDPVLLAGFDRLRRRVIEDTYSLSTALMAMEALYAPPSERQLLIEGRIRVPQERKLPTPDFNLMKEWTTTLLKNRQGDLSKPPTVLRFHYRTGSQNYDNSNTQYALLGLYSAHLCNVPIDSWVWTANAAHWLQEQIPDRGKGAVKLQTTDHAEYARMRGKSKPSTRTVSGRRVKPVGWIYCRMVAGYPVSDDEITELPTGSMTTAGLAGLTICEAVLRSKKRERRLVGKLATARQAGFAWLLRNFTLRANPNQSVGWYYYYLYGFERACELNRIALLGDRDWYYEGATLLIENELPNAPDPYFGGMFPGATLAQDCFAILFLKQAAPPLPVITGRR